MHSYEQLQHFSNGVKEGTVSYLFDYISQVLQQKGSTVSRNPLHAVELDVAFHQTKQDGDFIYHHHKDNNANLRRKTTGMSERKNTYQYFSSEISGHVALHQTVISPSYTITPSNLHEIIDKAFEEDYSLAQYTLSIQTHIPTLAFLTVTDSENNFELIPLSSTYEGGGSKSRRSGDAMVSSLLAIGLVVLLTGLYVFFSREHRLRLQQRREKRAAYDKGHLLIDMDRFDFSDCDDNYDGSTMEMYRNFNEKMNDDQSISDQKENSFNFDQREDHYHTIESYDVGSCIQFIPVPARRDERTLDARTDSRSRQIQKNGVCAPTPRRYVQPMSPFEVLYGAAFCHSEKERVAVARGQFTPKIKESRSRRIRGSSSSKTMKPLRTMTSITEEIIGNKTSKKKVDKDEDSLETPSSESFIPQMLTSLSSYLQEKKVSNWRQTVPLVEEEPLEEEKEHKYGPDITSLEVEEGVVYRDFPRHDGTPCVMFKSIDESDWNANNVKVSEPKVCSAYLLLDKITVESPLMLNTIGSHWIKLVLPMEIILNKMIVLNRNAL